MHMSFSVGTGRVTDIHQVAQLARTAEECGYSRISFPDTPAFNRDVHVMMTVAALNTHRIHIGQGFTDPFTFHPFVIANATATVDELSGGRALRRPGRRRTLRQVHEAGCNPGASRRHPVHQDLHVRRRGAVERRSHALGVGRKAAARLHGGGWPESVPAGRRTGRRHHFPRRSSRACQVEAGAHRKGRSEGRSSTVRHRHRCTRCRLPIQVQGGGAHRNQPPCCRSRVHPQRLSEPDSSHGRAASAPGQGRPRRDRDAHDGLRHVRRKPAQRRRTPMGRRQSANGASTFSAWPALPTRSPIA